MSHSYFNNQFEALDEAPIQFKPLHLELTCCGATTPDVVTWPLTAGPDENGDYLGAHAYPGDEVPCPHCGELGTVYAISARPVLPAAAQVSQLDVSPQASAA